MADTAAWLGFWFVTGCLIHSYKYKAYQDWTPYVILLINIGFRITVIATRHATAPP